jgi:urease accessory protein
LNARVSGRLSLDFVVSADDGRTRMLVREAHQPLKVVRAFDAGDGAALVHLHNVSGGILSGDQFALKFRVGRNARGQITTTSATRVYRARQGDQSASQHTSVQVEENGLLELLPDPLIPFAGSDYEQSTVIDLADGAGLFWWETVTPGREARGEVFAYDRLKIQTEITACGVPVVLEHFSLRPQQDALISIVRLGHYRYFTTFYICRAGVPNAVWMTLEGALTELAVGMSRPGTVLWGVSTLTAHGLAVRGLSTNGLGIASGLMAFWKAAKQSLYGTKAIPPRKVY